MEKKEPTSSGANIRGLQGDSLARTGMSGDKVAPTMTPSLVRRKSISRTATGSSLTSKKAESPPPSTRTRKRSGKEPKEVSTANQKEAVKSAEESVSIGKKNLKGNEGELKTKCDRKDNESAQKIEVWSKDRKHMKQIVSTVANKSQEDSNSNKENTRGVENRAQKRETKEEVEVQKSNRNKFISNPLRRSLKSRKSIKRQGSVKRAQARQSEEASAATAVPKKSEQADPKKADDQTDPLNFIEIRSAAQWKAISQRISWKFDDCAEEDATEVEPAGKTRVLPKNRVGAVTLKPPQFSDLPNR